MDGEKIYPVILCGGSGSRLWPLSRKDYPKQFASFSDGPTLMQATARRLSGATPAFQFAPPVMVTASDFRFVVTQQLAQIGIDPAAVLIEPSGKNTAPAVLAAALFLAERDPDSILLVAPSDHAMPDTDAFHAALTEALACIALRDDLVTFGVEPTEPETGYGYLRLSEAIDPQNPGKAVRLGGFVEKTRCRRGDGHAFSRELPVECRGLSVSRVNDPVRLRTPRAGPRAGRQGRCRQCQTGPWLLASGCGIMGLGARHICGFRRDGKSG